IHSHPLSLHDALPILQVLFAGAGAELLDQFYGDGLLTSHWLGAITAAVQTAAHALPEGRGLRILEVGAGTGGLSAQILPALERRSEEHTSELQSRVDL